MKKVDELIWKYINSKAFDMYEEILNENGVLEELLAKIKVLFKGMKKKESIIHEIQPILPINKIFDEIQKLRDKASSQEE